MKIITNCMLFLTILWSCSICAQDQSSPSGYGTPFGPKYKEIDASFSIQSSPAEIRAINREGKELKIPCQTYTLSSDLEITDVSIDTSYNELFFLAKKSGKELSLRPVFIVGYNYLKNQIQWGKQSFHGKGISCLITSDNYIFRIQRFKDYDNFAFHKGTGQLKWNNDFELRNPVYSKEIAFNGFIDCIDLSTGQIRWSRKLDNDYGWMEEILLENNVMLTMVDGVHSVNLENGLGWDYHTKTGKEETGEMVGQILGSAIASAAFGTNSYGAFDFTEKEAKKYKFPDLKSHAINYSGAYSRAGLASNIKVENNRVYFSAMDKFLCVDLQTGKKIWEARLPDPRTGMAFVDLTKDKIVFINKGCGYRNKSISSYFIPYLLIFEKKSGKSLCVRNIKTPQLPVIDYTMNDTSLFLLTQNELLTYTLSCNVSGKLSSSSDSLVTKESGKFLLFLKKQALINIYFRSPENKNYFRNLASFMEEGIEYFLLSDKGVIGFDEKMHKKMWFPGQDLYNCQARFNSKCLLGANNEYELDKFVIDEQKNGEVFLHIKMLSRTEVENGHLIIYTASNKASILSFSKLSVD